MTDMTDITDHSETALGHKLCKSPAGCVKGQLTAVGVGLFTGTEEYRA